jgi:adenylate cyclase
MARMRASLRTFALYVPKALVAQLVEHSHGPELGGARREITILFMDLENFTAMSAHREPEEVMSRMSRYFEAVTQVLLAHGATIDKYIGDAVMAFWNAPEETPDHVALACRAALEVIAVGQKETGSWAEPGTLPLRTRIGIHTGSAIVGNVGSSDRMNYTALGAAVNLAARLEPLNRDLKTDILVSAAVAEAVSGRFAFESAGRFHLKGFDDEIEAFALKSENGSAQG